MSDKPDVDRALDTVEKALLAPVPVAKSDDDRFITIVVKDVVRDPESGRITQVREYSEKVALPPGMTAASKAAFRSTREQLLKSAALIELSLRADVHERITPEDLAKLRDRNG